MRVPTAEKSQAGPWRRLFSRRKSTSIRNRVLAIVLIPSAALLVTGVSVAGYLISEGLAARDFSGYLGQAIDPLVEFESVVQKERTISLRALGGDQEAIAGLAAQRDTSNAVLAEIADLAGVVQNLNPDAVSQSNSAFAELSAQLQQVRQGVDARQASVAVVDGFYTGLAGVVITGLEGSARTTPDAATAAEETTAVDLFWVTDLHSRAVGLAAGGVAQGVLGVPERLVVAQLSGSYRNQLMALTSRLTEDEKARYDRLVASDAWKTATAGEDALAQRGELDVPLSYWLAAEDEVSTELLGLWGDHFHHAESLAEDSANESLLQSILAGSLVLVLAVVAFLIAVRMANALVRRLRKLRTNTLDLADKQLPAMVQRIADGQEVDIDAELLRVDHGTDEIGQVAEAFETAQRTAVAAAAAEAKTRGGFNKVFLDIAHRSQIVVHRQLEVLDVAESKQGDPEHLELLFQLDHLATHARRNAENLLILGGGQPGRKWRTPVALEEIVRSAISETEDFARVSAVRLPDVKVLGNVVADLIHLLAELVDNATSFSPPDAPVTVRGNLVGKGVVVEVEDQGLGIGFEEREYFNETLRNPPDFQAMALAGQRHLGLFVTGQLAKRHGISVSLQESAYGGIKAIVLVPSSATEVEEREPVEHAPSPATRTGRHQALSSFVPQPAQDPVPRLTRTSDNLPRHWPEEEPEHDSPTVVRPSFGAFEPMTPVASTERPASAAPRERQSGSPASRERPPLPRRQRQANLVPQLQLDTEAAPKTSRARRTRTPEEAHNSMASFQRGTRQGRGLPSEHNR
ncbi:sensor histidine kinase [Actinophytocola oryzae]|uniref:histidine kinase n=1 Tax=Actinophytocola oryzae TaxID=502181 RepID=A0A4R7VWB8_9PSEU|nr:ATP-binding protein [Actinophytocola oryzae]TDV53945.1 signal transduction histidine kinase [Actinophytocola oryzae]